MLIKIFAFIKPSETATMFSHKMAKFLSQFLEIPITWNDDIAKQDIDLLIMVGGGMPFCQHLPALGKAVLRSTRVAYCVNDYVTTKLPKPDNKAKSPFRAAFRIRAKRKMKPPELWSTLDTADHYINWNSIAWEPDRANWNGHSTNLLYYGSWRRNRLEVFDDFFINPAVTTVISNATDRFKNRYPKCQHIGSLTPDIVGRAAHYGLGLYVNDHQSISEPPACRFYEMLSAGLPMVFNATSAAMLRKGGLDIPEETVIKENVELKRCMHERKKIAEFQRHWQADYITSVKSQITEALDAR